MTKEQVTGSTITTRVVERNEDIVQLEIFGSTLSSAPEPAAKLAYVDQSQRFRRFRGRDTEHGVRTRLLGHATYDLESERFTDFELVALGARWGETRFNGRRWDNQSASPVGYFFQLAPANAPRVAPGFIGYYEADWVKRPAAPIRREFSAEIQQ